MKRPIAISLSPNTQPDDIRLAKQLISSPPAWQGAGFVEDVHQWFEKRYGGKAFGFNSGRSAELELLKAFAVGRGDEVLVQAFTCVAVPNSILWAGARPIFVDIDSSYNIDCQDFERKIGKRSRAVIIQNTFGIPANISEIVKIARRHNLVILEDGAHSLGASYKRALVGTYGDGLFFSFGRDKIVSSVFGGVALVHDKEAIKRLARQWGKTAYPPSGWIFQQLLHPILFEHVVLPTYTSGLGKIILVLLQQLGIVSKAVYEQEKRCERPSVFPKRLPNALAKLALNQLKKLDQFNQHRQQIARLYFNQLKNIPDIILPEDVEGAVWLRFPIRTNKKRELLAFAKRRGMLLGDWYDVVTPRISLSCIHYQAGSCPTAEALAKTTVNLPTYPTLSVENGRQVVGLVKEFFKL